MTDVASVALRDTDTIVVEGANWRVATGDFWCIAGADGAGKSDFLMMVAGLLAPVRGSLKLFGEDLQMFEEGQLRQRLKLGFVFESGSLLNNLTIAENISLPLRYHLELSAEEISDRTSELLKLAELTPWANNTPGTLGRNWQKRVGLVRALALSPELLLVDNPLRGADLRHVTWWFDMIGQLAAGHWTMPDKRATTIVVTADDARSWQDHARQFARLHEGKFEVTTKEMLADTITKG